MIVIVAIEYKFNLPQLVYINITIQAQSLSMDKTQLKESKAKYCSLLSQVCLPQLYSEIKWMSKVIIDRSVCLTKTTRKKGGKQNELLNVNSTRTS